MIVSASRILEYVHPGSVTKVVDQFGVDAFPADYDRLRELVVQGAICGRVKGTRLKFVELLVPLAEVAPSKIYIQRASSGCKAEDSSTVARGRDELALTYNHVMHRCAAYAGTNRAYRNMVQSGV